jgi:hypothetical protein
MPAISANLLIDTALSSITPAGFVLDEKTTALSKILDNARKLSAVIERLFCFPPPQ